MLLFSLILFLLSFLSFSPQFIFFMGLVCGAQYLLGGRLKGQYLFCTCCLLVMYPSGVTGQSGILLPQQLFAFLAVAYLVFRIVARKFLIQVVPRELFSTPSFFIITIVLWCIFVYIPIPLATYFDLQVLAGAEELYVSNSRASHMLSFMMPLFVSLAALFAVRVCPRYMDLSKIYSRFTLLVCIYLGLSALRYLVNIDFIPQDYTTVRHDGVRLSGFSNPDPNGFARSLLLPMSLGLSYAISAKGRSIDWVVVVFCFLAILATMSRTTYVSMIILVLMIFGFNFSVKNFLRLCAIAFAILAFTIKKINNATIRASPGTPKLIAVSR